MPTFTYAGQRLPVDTLYSDARVSWAIYPLWPAGKASPVSDGLTPFPVIVSRPTRKLLTDRWASSLTTA
jgi:hypothetical protein